MRFARSCKHFQQGLDWCGPRLGGLTRALALELRGAGWPLGRALLARGALTHAVVMRIFTQANFSHAPRRFHLPTDLPCPSAGFLETQLAPEAGSVREHYRSAAGFASLPAWYRFLTSTGTLRPREAAPYLEVLPDLLDRTHGFYREALGDPLVDACLEAARAAA